MITAEQLYDLARRTWANRIRSYHPNIDREDAIQDAVLRAWLKRDQFDPSKATATTFFSTVIRNEIHQHAKVARNNYYATGTATDDDLPDFDLVDGREMCPLMRLVLEEEQEQLQLAIDSLPPTTQTVIQLRINGSPLRDIAEEFGVSHQAISTRYERALTKIRDRIGCHD